LAGALHGYKKIEGGGTRGPPSATKISSAPGARVAKHAGLRGGHPPGGGGGDGGYRGPGDAQRRYLSWHAPAFSMTRSGGGIAFTLSMGSPKRSGLPTVNKKWLGETTRAGTRGAKNKDNLFPLFCTRPGPGTGGQTDDVFTDSKRGYRFRTGLIPCHRPTTAGGKSFSQGTGR